MSACVALALLLGSAGEALGAPTIWERVLRPRAGLEERTRLEVERLLFEAELFGLHSKAARDRLELALRTLERIEAERAEDVRLRFRLGRILGLLGEHARAAAILEPLVAEAPAHPMVSEAFFRLAIAHTHAGASRRDDEIAMYDAFLRHVTAPGARAVALSNRAEARMARGELDAAIADYRASLAIVADPVATWGLAVALDRSGDFAAALAVADRALSLDPDDERLRNEGVFFLPAYERHWYEALGAIARARRASLPLEAALFWASATARFTLYIDSADQDDRWVEIARARRASCERERDAATRKRGKR